MTALAQAAQLALLPPLPPQLTGISIAARYRPATPGAGPAGTCMRSSPPGTASGSSSGTSAATARTRSRWPGTC